MLVTEEDITIFEATKAGSYQTRAILAGLAREGKTPEAMYEAGKKAFDQMGLSREEMITQFKIELINRAGGGNGTFDLFPSMNNPVKPIQQKKVTDTTNDIYERNKALCDGLGLTPGEVNQMFRVV